MNYDNQFEQVNNLTWFPWVGTDYASASRQILIVGESHYINEDTRKEAFAREAQIRENREHTRLCLSEVLIDKSWYNPTYPNLMEALCDRGVMPENKEALDKIAYYNFIQRQLNYTDGEQKPTGEDYQVAWTCFIDIVKILRPTDCVFLGVRSETGFGAMMNALNIEHSIVNFPEQVNGAYPRKATITLEDGFSLTMYFIKHPSMYFSAQKWHDFLKEQTPELINCINGK